MRVFRYFARAYPWQMTLVFVSMLLGGLLDGIGMSAFLPVLSVALSADGSEPSGFEAVVLEPGVGEASPDAALRTYLTQLQPGAKGC